MGKQIYCNSFCKVYKIILQKLQIPWVDYYIFYIIHYRKQKRHCSQLFIGSGVGVDW